MKFFSKEEYINKTIIRILGIKIVIKQNLNKITAENRYFYLQNWNNFPSEFVEKYQKLITGLDDESCFIISNIIRRIRKLKKKAFKYNFNFSKKEKIEYIEIKENLNKQLIYLGNNTWAYKDYLLQEGLFEPGIFYYNCYTKYLNNPKDFKNKNIIDVGAYIGDSSIILAKLTDKNVYAFEPVKQSFECLKTTIKLNKTENIIPINLGLGDEKTVLPITGQKSMGASFLNNTDTDIPVEVTTLDDYVEKNNLEVGLIKVDIEGFEQNFLKGAYNTIQKQKPTLLISIYHSSNDFFEIKPMIESWGLGYKFKVRKAIDNDVVRDTVLICEQA